ncbi:MAG: D-glucuronyl C5-epimerase family protein, partial [Candidatus Thorarchaeota archaeon]
NSTRIQKIFNLGIISASANLYKYDMDVNWTLYHLAYPQKIAPRNYHQIHIEFTNFLYEYSNVTVFKTFSDKWTTYTQYPSFTLAEFTSPEFIYFGFVMVAIIIGPLFTLDIFQMIVRNYLKKRSRNIPNS